MENIQYKINPFFSFFIHILFTVFNFIFRVKGNVPQEVKNLKGAYLLLGNHVGFWDAFLVGHFLKKKPHFVASDATLRDPIKRFFLTRFGVIPIRKNLRDTKVIRDMVSTIRQIS